MGVIKYDLFRYPALFALAIWVGGIFFFSIGVAPVAFHIFTSQEAGEMVRASLRVLHFLGLFCGVLFLASSAFGKRSRLGMCLVLGMMLLTAVSQWMITPRIEELRRSREVQTAQFSRLHSASTSIEGAVLLLGCIALWRTAKRNDQ